jgi:hypothetical protein
LLYIEYPWSPVMFWNSFCEWLGKTNLCQNLRASRFKFFGGTPPSSHTQNRVCLAFLQFSHPTAPLFCHLYAGKKSFDPPPPVVTFVTSLYVQF